MMENEEGSEWNIMINEANQDPLYRDLNEIYQEREKLFQQRERDYLEQKKTLNNLLESIKQEKETLNQKGQELKKQQEELHKEEQNQQTWYQQLCEEKNIPSISLEVVSFRRLANRVFRSCGGLSYSYIGQGGKTEQKRKGV